MTAAPDTEVRLEEWDGPTALRRVDDLIRVYKAAFLDVFEDDPDRAAADRRLHVSGHLQRPDVRVLGALDGDHLVGMTYVVPGRRGHWWHDVVWSSLPSAEAQEWLSDVVEIVELHVLPSHQGRGIGRRLLRASLAGAPQRTAALSALDDPTLPARHLYAAEGFVPLLEGFRFPGGLTRYAVLAKRLR
ncbi:MAG TPA: GNAT family N-acetyltransferase [Mycobacteriales bacterium]|nr:GNAT family N-acetyltransferase [Mycobacteriales bacterium]